jgi:hypothetical protein
MLPFVVLALVNLPLRMTLYLDGTVAWPAQPIPIYSDTQGDVDPIIPPTRRTPPVDPSSFNIPFTPPWTPIVTPVQPIPTCNCPDYDNKSWWDEPRRI